MPVLRHLPDRIAPMAKIELMFHLVLFFLYACNMSDIYLLIKEIPQFNNFFTYPNLNPLNIAILRLKNFIAKFLGDKIVQVGHYE